MAQDALQIRLLGPLEVVNSGRRVELAGARQRALLALLAVVPNQIVSRDRLVDGLWGDTPPVGTANALAALVSRLRRALPDGVVESTQGGYSLRLDPIATDIGQFEQLLAQSTDAAPAEAVALLRDALSLWRGPALADVAYDSWAQPVASRLEELRRTALADRIDAQLRLGAGAELVAELDALVRHEPLHERFRGQLMLALYRSGRQADALEAYRNARVELTEGLGLEPGPALQELERAILHQDPALTPPQQSASAVASLLACARDPGALDALIELARPLTARSGDELILALLTTPETLAGATAVAQAAAGELHESDVTARGVAFASPDPGEDLVKLAREQHSKLLLIDAIDRVPDSAIEHLLEHAPCDVGVLFADRTRAPDTGSRRPVLVPFGGAEHEWTALEIGAWIAASTGLALRLAGTRQNNGRDASRLLATASLIVQRTTGVAPEPILIAPGSDGVAAAAGDCSLIVIGLPDRWRHSGIGADRLNVAAEAGIPVLLVRRGLRPGGLAPRESLTHYTWSIAEQSKSEGAA